MISSLFASTKKFMLSNLQSMSIHLTKHNSMTGMSVNIQTGSAHRRASTAFLRKIYPIYNLHHFFSERVNCVFCYVFSMGRKGVALGFLRMFFWVVFCWCFGFLIKSSNMHHLNCRSVRKMKHTMLFSSNT